jgi:hypothetical protein
MMADFYNGFEYLSIFLNGNDFAIHWSADE